MTHLRTRIAGWPLSITVTEETVIAYMTHEAGDLPEHHPMRNIYIRHIGNLPGTSGPVHPPVDITPLQQFVSSVQRWIAENHDESAEREREAWLWYWPYENRSTVSEQPQAHANKDHEFALWFRGDRVTHMEPVFTSSSGIPMVTVTTVTGWGEAYSATAPTSEVTIRPYRRQA